MFGFLILGALAVSSAHAADTSKPNIVWVVVEDMSAHFGCYGEKAIATPNL
ncbi:MAG: arylsulfatase, partial [Gemmataceae bacterium]|nr:arylsulfatase [Gemmataceae bacterium]